MNTRLTHLAVFLPCLLLWAPGCATHSHRALGCRVDYAPAEAPDTVPSPAAATLAVAPVVVAAPDAPDKNAYPIYAERLRGQVVQVLRDRGGWAAVTPVGSGQDRDLESLCRATRDAGASALLLLDFEEASLRFVRHRAASYLNVLFWALGGGYLSNWFHDQVYELRLRPRMRLLDPAGGEVLLERGMDLATIQQALNFHERTRNGWLYVAENLLPPPLCPAQADGLLDSLAPETLDPLAAALRAAAAELSFDRLLCKVDRGEAPGIRFSLEAPANGGRAPSAVRTDIHLRIEAAGPDLSLAEIKLDGSLLWPVDLPEGAQPPPRKLFVLKKEGHPLTDRAFRVDVTDSAGGTSWLTVEMAPETPQEPEAAPVEEPAKQGDT